LHKEKKLSSNLPLQTMRPKTCKVEPILKLLLLVVTILVLDFSCQKKSDTDQKKLDGIWKSIGYGQQIEINDSVVSFYDTYATGCNFNFKVSKNSIGNHFKLIKLTSDSLTLKFGITEYDFIKAKSERENCDQTQFPNKNALTNFNALWHTFNENYCSFTLRQINWENLKNKYRKRLNEQSSEKELYAVLNEMLTEMNDGHVSINIPESFAINQENNSERVLRDLAIKRVNEKYLSKVTSYNKGVINWGFISNDIAYIQINSCGDLANYNLDQNLSPEEFLDVYEKRAEESTNYSSDVLAGVDTQIDSIVKQIQFVKYCIIDIRFNGGGLDEAGLSVLSHFIKKRIKVFTKKARFENGFTREQNIFINPDENYFDGNLFILTSHQTASAAEVFLLASMNLPKTISIGSNTEGIFSDVLSKKLPNGWDYGLSNEIYLSTKGISYEEIGIPADYNINYNLNAIDFYNDLIEELKKGDKAIETVFRIIKDESQ
jgi:carboxyl-terminal processing protease